MSLHRTLLYLLSLTSAAPASDQDILDNPTETSNIDTASSPVYPSAISPALLQRTVLTMQLETDPETNHEFQLDSTYCSASTHCLPGDYCFVHESSIRCCPEDLACFSITANIWYEQTVYWYEEVHVHYVDVDEDGGEGEEVAVVTEWEVESSVVQAATRVTVTASYPAEGRNEFDKLSRGVVREAETRVVLNEVPTRTREVTRGIRRTSEMEDTGMLGGFGDSKGQVVLGLAFKRFYFQVL
ncbi:hypothetical protein BJX62DRAFT_241242 [Aspergillus germanicus]